MVNADGPARYGVDLELWFSDATLTGKFSLGIIYNVQKFYQSLAPHGNVYAVLICICNSLLIVTYENVHFLCNDVTR